MMKEEIKFSYRLCDKCGDLTGDIYYSFEDIASALYNEYKYDDEGAATPYVEVQIYNNGQLVKIDSASSYIQDKYGYNSDNYNSDKYFEYMQAIDDEENKIWERVQEIEKEEDEDDDWDEEDEDDDWDEEDEEDEED